MNQSIKDSCNEFKKELTWNNFKILISALLPMSIGAWIYSQWFYLVNHAMIKYISNIKTSGTIEESIIFVCIICCLLFPVWPLIFWSCSGGLYLGRITRFYVDNKTRRLVFDDIEYSLKNMPQDQRDKIKEALSSYKSKYQLRKDKLANKSWFRRNFT